MNQLKSDSTFASCSEKQRSFSRQCASIEDVPHKKARCITLSVTEAECVAATSFVQDMMYKKISRIIGIQGRNTNDL